MLIHHYERIMATRVGAQIATAPEQASRANTAVEAALAWMREVDRCLSRFAAESDISRLNASAGAWVPVSAMLFEALEAGLAAAAATSGLFDPTILPVLEALGYDRDFDAIAYREAAEEWSVPNDLTPPGQWREIEMDHAGQRVRLPPGVRVDLGGITKGWAADVALDRFFGEFPNALVDVGGDLRARGQIEDGKPWPIGLGVLQMERTQQTAVITLSQGGLATSGSTARWWYRAGERQHHLIDPRTSAAAQVWIDDADTLPDDLPMIAAASALAPTAAHAEVAAKVALLRGYPAALEAVEAVANDEGGAAHGIYSDADVALVLTLNTGAVVFTTNLPDYLTTLGGGGDIWVL